MSEPIHGWNPFAGCIRTLIYAVVFGCMVFPRSASADPIRVHPHRVGVRVEAVSAPTVDATVSAEALMQKWEPYFARALQTQSLHVHGPNAVRLLSTLSVNDLAVANSSMVQYLEWRRSLNVVRFAAYHPQLSPMLEQTQLVRAASLPNIGTPLTLPPILGQGNLIPPMPTPPCPIAQEVGAPMPAGTPCPVPEPSTGAMALILVGLAAARRYRSRRP